MVSKRLLLVSDVLPLQNGMGISQTIFNLLQPYPEEQLMVYVPYFSDTHEKSVLLSQEHVAYYPPKRLEFCNRFGYWLNPYLSRRHHKQLRKTRIQGLDAVKDFSPEIILVLCNSFEGLIMANRILEYFSVPVISYFMDDWMYEQALEVHAEVAHLLKKSDSWLTISQVLEEIFTERYGISPQLTLSLHNPVKIIAEYHTPKIREHLEIVYAGSIWGMHFDALEMVAESVHELAREGYPVSLTLYTRQTFWDQYLKVWNKYGVHYGGLLSYGQLHRHLREADMLLVVSSFQEKYQNHSRSSLQTKTTDYMAAGRALLSVGPDYSICNQFVQKWDCGYAATSRKEIRQIILQCLNEQEDLVQKGKNGYYALAGKFNVETVFEKFNNHLFQVHDRSKSGKNTNR